MIVHITTSRLYCSYQCVGRTAHSKAQTTKQHAQTQQNISTHTDRTKAIHKNRFHHPKQWPVSCLTDLVDRMVTPTPQVAGRKQQQHVGVTFRVVALCTARLFIYWIVLYPGPQLYRTTAKQKPNKQKKPAGYQANSET